MLTSVGEKVQNLFEFENKRIQNLFEEKKKK